MQMRSTVPHIVQYQGSKRALAPQILNCFPKHFNRLVEPFAGMAAITIAVAQRNMTSRFIVNDLNAPLVNLLKTAIEHPGSLVQEYEELWKEQFEYTEGFIQHYYKVRAEFNEGYTDAAHMLYLLARCVKGSVRYASNGMFNQSPDKRRHGTRPQTLIDNVNQISALLKGKVEYFSSDYRDILDSAVPGDVIYMDPPYQGVCATRDSRYFSGIEFDSFVKALEKLNLRGIDYVVSYDGSCGNKHYGEELPRHLELSKILLNAGLSSQALLLGKKEVTMEALYISKGLQEVYKSNPVQQSIFAECI